MNAQSRPLPAPLESPSSARRFRIASAAALALFLLTGVATLGDYGRTMDEEESITAGRANVKLIADALAGRAIEWPWHELTGYQFLGDTVRASFAAGVDAVLPSPDATLGFHLFHLLVSAGTLLAVRALVLRLAASERLAFFTVVLLATTPKFVAHSQSNPKDVLAMATMGLALGAVLRAEALGRWRDRLLAGAALGLALAHTVLAVLWAPIVGSFVLATGSGRPRERLARLCAIAALGVVAGFALWPYLWPAPLQRSAALAAHLAQFRVDLDVVYFGRHYEPDQLPWHYTAMSILLSLPTLTLGLIGLGAARTVSGRAASARLGPFALLWLGVFLGADLLASMHYDGARHFLPVFPALAILAALGLERIVEALGALASRGRVRLAAALAVVLALLGGATLVQLVQMHPYEDAYLNEIVNAVSGEGTERRFELEIWGGSLKAGMEWLNDVAPRGVTIAVPYAADCARIYGRPDLNVVEAPTLRGARAGDFVMAIPRYPLYTPALARLERSVEPAFRIRRQNATVLRIWRLPEAPWE